MGALLVLGVCFAAGRYFSLVGAQAQALGGQDGVFLPCKDINGDGELSVSDPVGWLRWYFLGDSQEEPSCQNPEELLATVAELEAEKDNLKEQVAKLAAQLEQAVLEIDNGADEIARLQRELASEKEKVARLQALLEACQGG
jgi:hypothetical protein